MAVRVSPKTTEQVFAVYAETGSGVKTAARLGISASTVHKILRENDAEFASYRRLVRMRAVEYAWRALRQATIRLEQLIPECTDIDKIIRAYDRLAKNMAYTAGYVADDQAKVAEARKPIEMTQTTNVMDGNVVAEAVREAQRARAESGPSNGNRIHELRG